MAEKLLDLPVLRLTAVLEPTLFVAQPEGGEHRVVGGKQSGLVPVVTSVGLDFLGQVGGVQ